MPVSRRGGGEYDTQNFAVPSGVDTIHVMLDVNPNDFDVSNRSIDISIEVSVDGGQTWKFQMSCKWIGGSPPNNRGQIGWFAAVSGISLYSGNLCRVHFSTVGTFRWGLMGEII